MTSSCVRRRRAAAARTRLRASAACHRLTSPPATSQEDAVASEYTAAFSQLIFAREKNRYAFRGRVADPKVALAQALAAAAAAAPPGAMRKLIDASPAAVTLRAYVTAAGLPAV